jgi:uncharacterized Zn finger protein
MSRWGEHYGYFPPSRPRAAKGGIRAQSKRGSFGESWWAKRWIAVLEGFNIGARLQRGRRYARQGQVLSIGIEKGSITAKVQGSRPSPYEVEIRVKALSAAEWKNLAEAVSSQAIFAAKLLAGEMPSEIERVFQTEKLSLFPAKLSDLKTECSCPDWSNPCKHIAAVYYLLGEEFDRDPFLIFKMRGITREEFGALISDRKPARVASVSKASAPKAKEAIAPLPSDPALFWSGKPLPTGWLAEAQTPYVHAALPKRLGHFPFWRGEERFLDALESIYARASERGMQLLTGSSGGPATR